MNRWIRRVVPTSYLFTLWFFEALVVGFHLAFLYVGDFDPGLAAMRKQGNLVNTGLLMAAYIGLRMYAVHPLFRPPYHAWLIGTPWLPGMPLPLGPLHLVLQDLFVAVTLALPCAAVAGPEAIIPFLVFAAAYQLALAYFFLFYEPRRSGFAQVFLALSILPGYCISPAVAAATALAGTAFGTWALRFHMALYPWPPRRPTLRERRYWPPASQQLLPMGEIDYLSRSDGLILGLLFGWLTFGAAIVSDVFLNTRNELDAKMSTFLKIAFCFAAFFKLTRYLPGYAPPLTWWARLATGKIIIPRYDIVFVGPITALVCGVLLPPLLRSFGLSPLVAYPACAAAGMIGLLCIGPSLMQWKLTAPAKLQFCLQGSWMSKVARMQMNAADAGRPK